MALWRQNDKNVWNIELPLYMPWRYVWEVEVQLHTFLFSELFVSDQFQSPGTLRPGKAPLPFNVDWIGGWLLLRAGKNVFVKQESPFTVVASQTTVPLLSSPYDSHYTCWAVSAVNKQRTGENCDIAQRVLMNPYRRFEKTYRSQLQSSWFQLAWSQAAPRFVICILYVCVCVYVYTLFFDR